VIIATAGHVDHGKTSLIKALTGVDTDTLAEEKARGLTINLGYAYLPSTDGRVIGFIDVPGHHRFINTMIAGVSGIDRALVIIAADDGPMPQTREHVNVLHVLGVTDIDIVVTKIDSVTPERVAEVSHKARELVDAHGERRGQGVSRLHGDG
jgi:selenocysteine-specific elongation factor